MREEYIGCGNDSFVYAYSIGTRSFALKEYTCLKIESILQYHELQNFYAKKTFEIDRDLFKDIHYKGTPVKSISFSILHLNKKTVGVGCNIVPGNLNYGKKRVFSTQDFVFGETLKEAELKKDFTFTEKRPFYADRPTEEIEKGIIITLSKEHPIFEKNGAFGPTNIKIISFEDGRLSLCITDLGGNIKSFLQHHKNSNLSTQLTTLN